MSEAAKGELTLDRPAFMAALGLLPPYELDDVKAAYRGKVLAAHPDHGGDPADFIRLKEAYDHAVQYATFRGSRRTWIAAQVDPYLEQEQVITEVLRRGGRVEIERFAWMEKLWGDGFSLLAERLRHVHVRDQHDGDAMLAFLADHRPPYLVGLDVAGSRISTDGLPHLGGFDVLRWLDLSGAQIDAPALKSVLPALPLLEWLNVKNTRVGRLGRRQLQSTRPRLRVVAEPSPNFKPGNMPWIAATVDDKLKS